MQRKEYRELNLDPYEIADIARGNGALGSLVNGSIDLDNIDNVVRASSAIAIRGANPKLAVFMIMGNNLQHQHSACLEEIKLVKN